MYGRWELGEEEESGGSFRMERRKGRREKGVLRGVVVCNPRTGLSGWYCRRSISTLWTPSETRTSLRFAGWRISQPISSLFPGAAGSAASSTAAEWQRALHRRLPTRKGLICGNWRPRVITSFRRFVVAISLLKHYTGISPATITW